MALTPGAPGPSARASGPIGHVIGHTAWRIFPTNTKYFGESTSPLMINYRVANMDRMLEQLRKNGVKIEKVATRKNGVVVEYTDDKGLAQKLECDRLIVSVGRVPNSDSLGAGTVGLKIDGRGFVEVDDHCRTNLPNVYAIGDVVRGPMLAHKAEDEGVMVAEIIAGQKPHLDYDCIPWIIYTSPEIAWVGKSEQQARAAGIEVKTGQFPFSINGRALGLNEPNGFVKIVADAKTDRVLGVHMIHARASDLIQEGVTTMEFKGAAEDIARITHGHPTLSEVVREAALNVEKRALNM